MNETCTQQGNMVCTFYTYIQGWIGHTFYISNTLQKRRKKKHKNIDPRAIVLFVLFITIIIIIIIIKTRL